MKEKLGKAIQDLQKIYFDLEHGAETPEKLVLKSQFERAMSGELTTEEMDKIFSDTYDKIESGLYAITPIPYLSLEGVKNSGTKSESGILQDIIKNAKTVSEIQPPRINHILFHCSNGPNDFPKGGIDFSDPKKEVMINKEGKMFEIPKLQSPNPWIKSFSYEGKQLKEAMEKISQSLNTLNQNKMEKKIIGYTLDDEKYREAVERICAIVHSGPKWANEGFLHENTNNVSLLKRLGLIQTWFNPVYEKTITLPEIGGYQGEEEYTKIKYGCKKVQKDVLIEMSELGITSFNLKVDGKKIKVSKAQTKQLFEYVNKK